MKMAEHRAIDPLTAEAILAGSRGRKKAEATATRDITTWFGLNHHLKDDGCDNPDCTDPRDKEDKGRRIIIYLKDNKACCRFCFIAGWLRDA